MFPKDTRLVTLLVAVTCAFILTTPALGQIPDVPDLPPSIDAEVPFTGVQSVYQEDFELDDGNWTTSEVPPPPPRPAPVNPQWAWGVPTSGPGVPFNGTNVWGTNLAGEYAVPTCAAIMSPPIDLSGASSASVSFQHWLHMDTGTTIAFHMGLIFVTTDGGATLTRVVPQGGYDSANGGTAARACLDQQPTGTNGFSGGPSATWNEVALDLGAYAGQDNVQVLMAMGTDGVTIGGPYDGWYIDEFAVTVDGATTVESFEGSDGGFTVTSTALPGQPQRGWDWDQPSSGPDHVGNVWATNPHGVHGHDECHWIESPPFILGDLPSDVEGLGNTPASFASLSWRQWFRTSALIAQGAVQVGTSDGEYHLLRPDSGYDRAVDTQLTPCLGSGGDVFAGLRDPVGGSMNVENADLTEFLGEEITLRFVFASRSSGTTNEGWYIDDVRVDLGFGASARVGIPNLPGSPDAPFTRLSTLYAEDFEFNDGGWTETGTGEWDWGAPSPPPVPPSGSFNMWGTDTRGAHSTNACSWVTSPSISIPGADLSASPAELALLELDLFVDTTSRHDGAILEVSTDGGATWEYVMPEEGYDAPLFAASGGPSIACLGITAQHGVWTGPAADADDWRRATVDMTRFMGEDVQLRLGFGSNAIDDDRRGVYMDRLVLSLGVGADTSLPDPSGLGIVRPGWEVTGDNPSWLYGLSTSGPTNLRPVWATGLHGPYNPAECSSIVSPAIDTSLIPGLGNLEMTFEHVFSTPLTTHAGIIEVSKDDGATWNRVTPIGGYNQALGVAPRDCLTPDETGTRGFASNVAPTYTGVTVPLQSFQDDTIRVRFSFHSTSTTNLGDGWYIRDLGLTRGAGTIPLGDQGLIPLPDPQSLLDVVDPGLLRLIDEDGDEPVEAVLTGPAHTATSAQSFDTRDEWMQWFDEQGADYIGQVEDVLSEYGGEVLSAWSFVPAMHVRAPVSTLSMIPSMTDTWHMVEVDDMQVQLVDPIEPTERDGVGVTNTNGRNMVEAETAWALGYMGEGIRIAVIDTGIDPSHEALKFANGTSRLVGFADCIGSGCNGNAAAFDDHGHGTHVAATAAGSNLYNDTQWGTFQETGVAPRAEILGVKFLNSGGGGTFPDGIDALQWSFQNDAFLTSNSWGGSCAASGSVIQAVNQLSAAGMLSVFSAGNSGPSSGTIGGPACADTALNVGAMDDNEQIASFSSRGPCSDPTTGTGSRICPDVSAKGVDVRSAIPRSGATWSDASGYRVWSGTSMSAPHVAGVAAIAEQMKLDLTGSGWDIANGAMHEVLCMTAKPLGTGHPNNVFGCGLPKLSVIYALLNTTDEANIISTFDVSAQELWLGGSTTLHFGVRNLGGAIATGDFQATLTDPEGTVTVLDDSSLSLALLDGHSVSEVFAVVENVLPGDYVFEGTFAYEWTDPDDNVVQNLVEHVGTFTVNRVFFELEIDGFPEQASLLEPQQVTVFATNTGNEDGQNVRLEFTVPGAYMFLPADLLNILDPDSQYSDPPPDEVHEDDHFGRTTLIYHVGSLPEGESFGVSLNLLPTETGTHWVRTVAKFQDGAGTGGLQSKTAAQTVEFL